METALTNADLNENDIGSAPRLMEIIIQNCRGRVDHCIAQYIALALNRRAACLALASFVSRAGNTVKIIPGFSPVAIVLDAWDAHIEIKPKSAHELHQERPIALAGPERFWEQEPK